MCADIVSKWLPSDDTENLRYFKHCRALFAVSSSVIAQLSSILLKDRDGTEVYVAELDESAASVRTFVTGLLKMNPSTTSDMNLKYVQSHRRLGWRARLWMSKLAVSRLLRDIITRFLDSHLVDVCLRLSEIYNNLLEFTADVGGVNVFCNTCPMVLYPSRKLSATRLLQMLSSKKAESTSYLLLEAVLLSYEPMQGLTTEKKEVDTPSVPLVNQDSVTSDTSVEIFRALTQHLHPHSSSPDVHQALIKIEERRAAAFLNVTAKSAPQLLPPHCVKENVPGEPKVESTVKKKLISYYQDLLWSEVGGYLEHGMLWWCLEPLGCALPSQVNQIRSYLCSIRHSDKIPKLLTTSLDGLIDALTCHLTSTSWDHLFRTPLVSVANLNSTYMFSGAADTGQLFLTLLKNLTLLSNSCENSQLTLEELPLVEQIPILHRLDHSVHTTRLWALSKCRQLANQWSVDEFYTIAYVDITKCLEALDMLQLPDHGKINPGISVHVEVCAKMRTKLISEVRINIGKLRETTQQCVDILAKNCRTTCLAHLHLTCPPVAYWKQTGPLPDCASDYVENYLDCVLRPIFDATTKLSMPVRISSTMMVLRIVCESWLEHIYLHRVTFTEWGAVQLLTDFGSVPTWLMERIKIPKELLSPLLAHEVLKRCEGVGRLLLRRRGETIAMVTSTNHRDNSADNMPAEMYVTNQEQWLELRASRNFIALCCQL